MTNAINTNLTNNNAAALHVAEMIASLTGGRLITDRAGKYNGQYSVEMLTASGKSNGIYAHLHYRTDSIRLNANIEGIHNNYFDLTGKDHHAVAELVQIVCNLVP